MPRRQRLYLPDLVYEITSTTLANSYALRPCRESTDRILGVYGRALELFPSVKLHALNPLSTHDTALVSASEPKELSEFIQFVKTNVSKEIRRLHGLPYSVFGGKRASPLPVSPDPVSLEHRFRYVLAQGTKEDLVESPRDWPGVTGVHSLETGQPLVGTWYDRTAETRARRRGPVDPLDFASQYEVHFSPLPCWRDMPASEWRARVTDIVNDIEAVNRQRRKAEGKTVLGAEKVMAFSPRYIPDEVVRSPSPIVLAAGKRAYRALRRVFDSFCDEFSKQSRRSREEPDADITFPPLSFPPGKPMTPGPGPELDLGRCFAPG